MTRSEALETAIRRYPSMLHRLRKNDRQGCGINLLPGEIDNIRSEFKRIMKTEAKHAA